MTNLGLVLSGGGARGAYQAGVLKAVAELTGAAVSPFNVVTGVSAGALNAIFMGTQANNFPAGVERLWRRWQTIEPDHVYRTDVASLASIGTRWMRDLSLGGLWGGGQINHLLDTAPLRKLVQEEFHPDALAENLRSGVLRGAAVSATDYATGEAITFYDGAADIPGWRRSGRHGTRAALTVDHLMASSAIPLFFPPVRVDGAWLGDGCVRLTAPLSPAIHLGADRVLAVGIRHARRTIVGPTLEAVASPADIAGVLLNAVFLDALESDVERMERINGTLSIMTAEQRTRLRHPLRRVPVLYLRPSQDLGTLARDAFRRFPAMLRHLLKGIGAEAEKGWELISYLAFEPRYTMRLLALGYDDTMRRRRELLQFLHGRPHLREVRAAG
ncbi:MAG: patatin-like phospholipase family protein [Myxococcota bacterium]